MREVADGFIGEIINRENDAKSSTNTSFESVGKSGASIGADTKGFTAFKDSDTANIIMLARNKEFNGVELSFQTKRQIDAANSRKAEFIVGDMSGVDSQFIDYLQEIGANFTIYHTGAESRIKIEDFKKDELDKLPDCI